MSKDKQRTTQHRYGTYTTTCEWEPARPVLELGAKGRASRLFRVKNNTGFMLDKHGLLHCLYK